MNRIKTVLIIFVILFHYFEAAAELVEVEVRTGDTLHGFAAKYLKDPSQWPKIHKLNKQEIRNPDRIFPGQIVKIPIEMLKDKVGDLVRIIKDVKVKKREGKKWSKGKLRERLFPEDGIMTGSLSKAKINFLVGSSLDINPNSLIYLKPTVKKTAVASLLEGGLRVQETKIITPSAEIIPKKNSDYNIDIDKDKTTKVAVNNGEVDVKARGKTVTVVGGYRTMVRVDRTPEKPIALPLSGEEAIEFKDELALSKNLKFLLQIAKTRSFDEIFTEKKITDLKEETIKGGLEPGQYYWRAAVVDADSFKGKFSEPRAIVVAVHSNSVIELTSFVTVNSNEGIMKITGVAQNVKRVVINGYPATVKEDNSFSTNIVITAGQKVITVTAIGSDGIVLRKYRKTFEGKWVAAN